MMRQLGKQLADILGQTFVVDNRAGGAGAVAMATLMGQPADGYNILSTTSSMSFTMATGRIPFGPQNFTVLPAMQAEPSAVAVRADSRFKTLKQLVDYLRDNPDKLSVGGFSAAGFHQFVFYRLQQEGKFKADLDSLQGRPGGGPGAARRAHRRRRADAELGAGADPERRPQAARHQLRAARRIFPGRTDLQGAGPRCRRDHLAWRHGQGWNTASR